MSICLKNVIKVSSDLNKCKYLTTKIYVIKNCTNDRSNSRVTFSLLYRKYITRFPSEKNHSAQCLIGSYNFDAPIFAILNSARNTNNTCIDGKNTSNTSIVLA